jgi:DNA-binding CsgD family transcriptional regulator
VRNDEETVRYRMLETIRQYGVAKLAESGTLDRWRDRHRDWYASLVARSEADWIGPNQLTWMERLRAEHANLRAALEHSVSDPVSAPGAQRMCYSLEQYWICSGQLSEARHWSELALTHGTGTDAERSRALHICVYFATTQSDLETAQRLLHTQRALMESSGDDVARGCYLYDAALLASWGSRKERGRPLPLLLESVQAFRKAGDLKGEVNTMFLTGVCLSYAGELERATAMHRDSLALLEPRGELFTRSYSLWALGLDALKAHQLEAATSLQHEALQMKWAMRDLLGIAFVFETLGWIAAASDRGERGATLLGAAEAIWRLNGPSMSGLPYIASQRRAGETLARGALSEEAFEQAFHDGLALSTTDAVSFALEEAARVTAVSTPEGSPLTKREDEVAELIGGGLSNREIAARLVISQRTAQGHVENILRKLGFTSRTQVAAWVAERK